MQTVNAQTGRQALLALFRENSLLGPLRTMFRHFGYFFQIPLPGFSPYVVSGPEANRAVLVTGRDRLRWHNLDPVTDLLRHSLLVVDGEEHAELRSLMEKPLSPGQMPDFAEMISRQTDRVSAGWCDGQVVDMLVEGRKIALLVIMQALFSVDIWDDLPRLWQPILKAIAYISPGPWILWRRMPRFGYQKHLVVLDAYLYRIISARRNAHMTGPVRHDLLGHLIAAGLDDGLIRDQMLTMLIAGHDTSTALLAWTFALLGQHPDVLARLVRELDETPDARPALLDEVIKEALRLYPPIHLGNRMVAEAISFKEGVVPAGERLFYSIYLSQRDPATWERPDEFCPERFARGCSHAPFSYLPFGGGPRACIGAAFGQAEARIVVARLLQTFGFEPLNAGKIRAHMGATLEPRPGVPMKVRRRDS
jgi:cytochrome P450